MSDPAQTALVLPTRTLRFDTPALMGTVNVTPDSFSDGGRFVRVETAMARVRALVSDGAQIIDIGGESTRPGAEPVSEALELERVVPIIEAVAAELPVLISVDTRKASVARAALTAGAQVVNDVSALGDPRMAEVVAAANAGLVLMHMRGEPQTMQEGPLAYDDVVHDVRAALSQAIARAEAGGVRRERILIDPGLGFGKTTAHNLELTRRLGELATLGLPIVYGASRKRFLGEITGRSADDRERATAAACVIAVIQGASVLRVHDVSAVRDAVLVAAACRQGSPIPA